VTIPFTVLTPTGLVTPPDIEYWKPGSPVATLRVESLVRSTVLVDFADTLDVRIPETVDVDIPGTVDINIPGTVDVATT
jgi:hypothetical protein